jgi:hypothetical protein
MQKTKRPIIAAGTPNNTKLRTKAWLLLGISSVPGELTLRSGQLSFTAHSAGSAWPWQLRKLQRRLQTIGTGARSVPPAGVFAADPKAQLLFKWSAAEVRAWSPWYYFGGGIKLEHAGLVLRFSFEEPANMRLRARSPDLQAASNEIKRSLDEMKNMRARGRLWQAALRNGSAANVRESTL